MKKFFLFYLFFVLIVPYTVAQNDTSISLVVYGEGVTQKEATENALRSAIEQTFGAFVSANTEVINDDIVKNEIATISSGNIKKFKVVAENKINDTYCVTINAVVSINNLITYVQSHGFETEFSGQAFMMEMKMRQLNTLNEETALMNLCDYVKIICKSESLFDYSFTQREPQYLSSDEYRLVFYVQSDYNTNYKNIIKVILDTYQSLELKDSDCQQYSTNNYPFYSFTPLAALGYTSSFNLRSRVQYLKQIDDSIQKAILDNFCSFCISSKTTNGLEYNYCFPRTSSFIQKRAVYITLPGTQVYNISGFSILPICRLNNQELSLQGQYMIKNVDGLYSFDGRQEFYGGSFTDWVVKKLIDKRQGRYVDFSTVHIQYDIDSDGTLCNIRQCCNDVLPIDDKRLDVLMKCLCESPKWQIRTAKVSYILNSSKIRGVAY